MEKVSGIMVSEGPKSKIYNFLRYRVAGCGIAMNKVPGGGYLLFPDKIISRPH